MHQLRGGLAEDDFAMRGGVIGMRVADKNRIRPLRFMRIQPKAEAGQVNPTAVELQLKGGHDAG